MRTSGWKARILSESISIVRKMAPTKQYNLSIDQKFLGIDDIYILDMQEELSKADDKMPLVDFLASMELKVAEVIEGKKP